MYSVLRRRFVVLAFWLVYTLVLLLGSGGFGVLRFGFV